MLRKSTAPSHAMKVKKPGAIEALRRQTTTMRTTLRDLEAEAAKSTPKISEWTAMQQRIQDNLTNVPHNITLNVGGKLFQTTKQTLLHVEGSYFHALLSSTGHAAAASLHFLDVDPDCFRRVLKFLRSGKMALLNGLTKLERDEVNATMEFLKLEPPTAPPTSYQWDIHRPAMQLSSALKSVESDGSMNSMNMAVVGQPLVGSIQLRVDKAGDDEEEAKFLIGLSVETEDDARGTWFSSCSNGNVFKDFILQACISPIVGGDIVTIRRGRSHVEFQLNTDAPCNIDLDDATDELFPMFATSVGGVKMSILEKP